MGFFRCVEIALLTVTASVIRRFFSGFQSIKARFESCSNAAKSGFFRIFGILGNEYEYNSMGYEMRMFSQFGKGLSVMGQ